MKLNGLIIIILLVAFGHDSQSKNIDKSKILYSDNSFLDTTKTAVISFDQKGNYPFDNSFKPASLTSSEIQAIDISITKCLTDYNNSLQKENNHLSIDLAKIDYKRQLIAVTNKNGEKEVWVNYLCNTWAKDWHSEIILVKDGGNCYFNLKINLAKSKCYELTVNGEA